ncbi:MAG: TonB-dependent receptor [Sulfurovum sp.]|nr:TonB-dependent receptor [Sulfurovum sp.]
MTSKLLSISIVTASVLLTAVSIAEEITLDPIIVGADFHEKKLSETTTSLSVIGEELLYDKASQSFEEVVGQIPNVNFSSGASRSHYIQIRGIGERSQFSSPVNPSVGLMIDGIDFSQSALGMTLFDTEQIEVLKGPQGTTFGANGMAGVVNIQTKQPSEEFEGHIEATVGTYNTKAVGVALGGSLIEDVLEARVSVYKNSSDGTMENSFLNRKDTQNIDELTAKLQLRWYASDNHVIDFNFIHVDVDNGYDAFTFDNSRVSHADAPGTDAQLTNAFAIKSNYQVNEGMHLISKVSHSQSEVTYSYDEDWSYAGEFDESLYPYSSFDEYLRDRTQTDIDVRLVSDEAGRIFDSSTDWTIGAYYKDYSEDLTRNYTYLDNPFTADYATVNKAIYGQLDSIINDKLTLVTGLRVEAWDAEYSDSYGVSIDTDEVLIGGKVGFNYQATSDSLYYTYISKGYKPGGVNADNTLSPEAKAYQTENLWNLELGMNSKHLDNTLINRLNVFYGKRKDQQVKSSVVTERDDGSTSFVDYLANAAQSTYYGVESQIDWYPNERLHLFSSIGLLQATFNEYQDPNPSAIDMNDRTPAQSPEYQYNIGFDLTLWEGWIWKANLEGKGSYYFSNRHNEQSEAYTLANTSMEYTNGSWSAVLWVRNIADTEYQTRGFGSFGNNPSNGYATELYTQQGMPRTAGLTLSYDF